ncbi:MAG: restriction endonuclease subunit S [Desulfobacterales bacterium]
MQFDHDYSGSFGAFCKLIRPKKELFPKYLYHFFRTPYYRGFIEKSVQGANINNLKNQHIDDMLIPIPSIFDDQIRIATLLSRIEALIATRKDNLRLLDEFLKSTFLEMFGDPVRNEKEFEVRRLSEFYIDPKNGTKCGPFGSALKKEEYVKSGVPVWNMDNISKDGKLQPDVKLWITDDKFEKLKGYSTINGDVIISRAGTVGKMCVLNTLYAKSIISTNLIRVRFGQGLLPIYFVSLMTYCKGRVGKLRTGPDGAFTHMNTGILDKLHFPYPPIELQNQFAITTDKVESLKPLYQQSLSELENLYGALSQKAFKGKLDLSRIPLEKVPEETLSVPTPESVDQFPEPDGYAMSDPAAREKLLRQLFDAFIAERKGHMFSMEVFWTQAEQKVLEHMDDESPPLGVADYDKAKELLFELIKSGNIRQLFYEENNYMGLSIKR